MLQPKPPGFEVHEYEFSLMLNAESHYVWKWLNDPDTFTKSQVWPYKVEFYSPNMEKIPSGFNEGVLTNHTGPFVNFAGKLITINTNYRDLQYYYGSYALSFGWIRPYRLEFWTEDHENDQTKLTCKISSYVKPGIAYKLWDNGQKLFWSSFRSWARKSVHRLQTKL